MRLAIGEALLAAQGEPLTSRRLAAVTSRDQSNIAKEADRMAEAGLLERMTPPRSARGERVVGRPPGSAYRLLGGQRRALEHALERSRQVGLLRVNQQLVLAEVTDERLDELHHVLLDTPGMAQAVWSALSDGERQEYVLVLEGAGAVDAAIDLMGRLRAAEVRCRRATVAQILPIGELMARADASVRVTQDVRLRQAMRRASNT